MTVMPPGPPSTAEYVLAICWLVALLLTVVALSLSKRRAKPKVHVSFHRSESRGKVDPALQRRDRLQARAQRRQERTATNRAARKATAAERKSRIRKDEG